MTRRDVIGRYRGSLLGVAWSFLNPLLMLGVYTFVFGAVFQSRWPERSIVHSKIEFVLILFAGIIIHSLMADCLTRAPTIILSHVNYVKKVVFPLEILPIVVLLSALFHAVISTLVLLAAILIIAGSVPITVITLPFVLIPYLAGIAGFAWFLASLGVFLRDTGQVVGVVTTLLMFIAPIFFPLTNVPSDFRILILMNPITWFVETARDVLLWGVWPDVVSLVTAGCIGISVAYLGLWWFQKTREGFSDVL